MINLIQNIKNELFQNDKLNFKALLFLLSEPAALIATYFMISRGQYAIKNPQSFSMSTFYTVLFTLIAFCLRILYQLNKPLALFFVILNCLVWGFCLYIWIEALLAYNKYKNTTKKEIKK